MNSYHQIIPSTIQLYFAAFLHYNFFFSLLYFTLHCRMIHEKVNQFRFHDGLQKLILLPSFLIWIIAEIPRIYIGLQGILYSNIPNLSTFLLLSIFPQFLITIYLGNYQEFIFPCDKALSGIMLSFLSMEVVFGVATLRELISWKRHDFLKTLSPHYGTNGNNIGQQTELLQPQEENMIKPNN